MIREVLADGSIDRGGAFQSIPRPRVQARLAEACAERVALIVAPAGYGKSVALNAYLESIRGPYVRFDVDESGTNLAGFIRGFVEVLRDIAPAAEITVADALKSVLESTTAGVELSKWLHAHIRAFGGTIVIDDFHKSASDPEIARFLSALIEKTKQRTKWLIATRSTTDLPVASWLAYGTSSMAVDDDDLAFTLDEARSSARALRLAVRDEELSSLLDLTNGWPTAVVFALRSSTRSNDLKNIAATTREMIYRYLAEQVYHSMPEDSRNFLRDAACLQRLDVNVLQAMGYDRAESMLEELRHTVSFISIDSPGRYRIHDLFRDFLEYESRMLGKSSFSDRIRRVARALEESDRSNEALALYKRAEDSVSIVRIIESVGFDLSSRGGNEALESAIATLPSDFRAKNPTIVGLRAMFQADRNRTAEAERLFRRAISFDIDPSLRARFVLALNSLFIVSGKTDAIPLLEDPRLLNHETPETRIDVVGALAACYAIAGRIEDSQAMIETCLDVIDDVDDGTRARTLSRLSVAYYYCGEYERVEKCAIEGAALAAEIGLFALASKCFSSLYAISSMRGDNTQALWFAQQSSAAAMKAANKSQHTRALWAVLDIESQRGNSERVEATLRSISELFGREALNEPFVVLEALSLQAAWNGSYERAWQYLAISLKDLFNPAQIAMRQSLMAIYLAALGRRDEAVAQLAILTGALEINLPNQDRVYEFAVVFSSLANVLLGRCTIAKKLLRSISPLASPSIALWHIALNLTEDSIHDSHSEVESALRALTESGYGGYAILLQALPFYKSDAIEDDTLTPTEQTVLGFLDRGMRPKAIAETTGRSVHTVQNHIRSVISKLGTSGREEALVVARRRGLVPRKPTSQF